MEAIIRTYKASKVYNSGMPDQVNALHEASIEIGQGEIVVLKGPSGSGKTTLLSLIGCMARPTQGSITVHGKDVAKLPERFLTNIRRRTFGFVFQQFNLIRGITVMENVLLPLYPLEMPFKEMKHRAGRILEHLNISHKSGFMVKQLSGGEQQRVAIARALINDPLIILADEPTAHLDSKLSREFTDIVQNLNKEGKTIVIATHDPEVYDQSFINRTIEMKDGRVLANSVQ